jgi:hypothetical protein
MSGSGSEMDSQLHQSLVPPQKCQNGCARWDNLAADGNTQDQLSANAMWNQGAPPSNASNTCATPGNNPNSGNGPWCYCAGTNDASWGYCQNRDNTANQCKSNPTGLNDLMSQISKCTSNAETLRNANFAKDVLKVKNDLESQSMIVIDSLTTGDSIFGQASGATISKEIIARNKELKEKKSKLREGIDKNEAIVERSNRDFLYTREDLPENISAKKVNFIEDYTVAFVLLTYIFMIISLIYFYTVMSENKIRALIFGVVGSTIISIILGILFYLLA